MTDFEEYIRQNEPDKQQRADAWQTAIGLQAVDELNPSAEWSIQTNLATIRNTGQVQDKYKTSY